MSGAEDLARLTQTIDTANELFLSEEIKMVDVGGGVQRPTNAKVLADLSTQMSGAIIYTTTALGVAGTPSQGYFSVLSSLSDEYVILYRNNAGVAVEVKRYPNDLALKNMQSLVRRSDQPADYFNITDEEGGARLSASSERIKTEFFELRAGEAFGIIDEEGGSPIYADSERALLGPLEVRYTDYPGVLVVNEHMEVIPPPGYDATADVDPLGSTLLFSPNIAVAEGSPSKIYPVSILSDRLLENRVVSSIFSLSTIASEEGKSLTISDQYGPDAALTMRKVGSDSRATLQLKVKVAPKQVVPKPLKILFIADSIGNNQGAYFLKEYLESQGYAPTFIGTVKGSALNARYDTGGPLGEARSGWQMGDYVFSKADRALVVAPGAELTYLAMQKSDQFTFNPFLRLAAEGDAPEVIRNGYVFDPAYYQTRFGLEAPDVVINALGTNDATSLPAEGFYQTCYDNDVLFNRQVSAAWPNAKIVRTVPATGLDPARNIVWTRMYTTLIRAFKDAALLNTQVQVAPVWAMMNPNIGFPLPETQAAADGFVRGTWSDAVHPSAVSRREYYKAMAPFVAVAALNL